MTKTVNVIGAGLAGSEAALYLALRGVKVNLYDIKGTFLTPAHHSHNFAELVCSNSLKSELTTSASGILKAEMVSLGSNLLPIAYACSVGAGNALAVNRELFSNAVSEKIRNNENINIISKEVKTLNLDEINIIATGPLTTPALSEYLQTLIGGKNLYFFDAASPIVSAASINMDIAFEQNRYDKGDADYINCPLNKIEYDEFYKALIGAETATLKDFEQSSVFESCMPIEVLAKRNYDAIRFGPMKPVGLMDLRTNSKPFAVVQLRREDTNGTMYNIVGFQTNLIFAEQKRVFRLIPGLEKAEFLRFGVMHKNTYINYPMSMDIHSRLKSNNNIFVAGQLSGVEGYVESMASGLYCAINVLRYLDKCDMITLSPNTIIGGLYNYLSLADSVHPQPINANLGILTPLNIRDKSQRDEEYARRSRAEIDKIKQIIGEV